MFKVIESFLEELLLWSVSITILVYLVFGDKWNFIAFYKALICIGILVLGILVTKYFLKENE
jgi:hypothetical protein